MLFLEAPLPQADKALQFRQIFHISPPSPGPISYLHKNHLL